MCGRSGGHLWYSETFPFRQRMMTLDWTVCCRGDPVPTTGGWHFTSHAVDRALDMALAPHQIKAVLEPQVKQPSGPKYPDGYEIWASGRIAAVVVPAENVIVTFLWRAINYERGTDSEPYRD